MGKIADTTRSWSLAQEQRRQILAFDVELEDAIEKVRRLDAKTLDLEKQVEPLQRQVAGLKKQLEEQTTKTQRAEKLAAALKADKPDAIAKDEKPRLSDHEEEVLKYLAFVRLKIGEAAPLIAIAKALKVNEIRAQVIVRGLQEQSYIWLDSRIGEGWKLNDRGEKYLVDHDFI